jgi:hypothetical protein
MWRTILVTGFLDPSLAMLASLVMVITQSDDSHNSHSLVLCDRGHPLAFDDVRMVGAQCSPFSPLLEVLMHELDGHRALTDGRCDALD